MPDSSSFTIVHNEENALAPTLSSKSLPQNVEAEKAVLAAMILDNDVIEEALIKLKPDSFSMPSHRKVFEAMHHMSSTGIPVDQLSLADTLESMGELKNSLSKAYILELANNSFALANWAHHADIVERQALLRDLITASTKISALCYDAPEDAKEVVAQSEKMLLDVTNKSISTEFRSLGDLMAETLIKMEEYSRQGSHLQGLTTGFKDLDTLFSGLRAGDLIVLAARPGLGKTAFALNVAVNAAKAGSAVAFFSLEMPAEQLIQRIVCTEGKVSLKNIRSGSVHDADWPKIIKAGDTLSKCDFWIDDSSALTVTELRAKARRQLRGKRDGLIVVDYLQLMESPYRQNKDRHLEVAEFTRGLKLLAKDLRVPIIVLSQLNRQTENSKDRRPQLSNLRESGAIEQDADIVMFIDRYDKNEKLSESDREKHDRPADNTARIIVAKHRNGPLSDVDLQFNADYTKFQNLASHQEN